jgi:glycosyltransferase involved in cell wall biosynthesis
MRILLVSHYFPPYNHIGAVRTGKMAKYLVKSGHSVRVISASKQLARSTTLPVEVPEESITYSYWWDWAWRLDFFLCRSLQQTAMSSGPAARGTTAVSQGLQWRELAKKLRDFFRTIAYFPDAQVGWLPFAVSAGSAVISQWRPDVIYASAGPWTSLLAARRLSRKYGIPWVAELRDLWVDNAEYQHPRWRFKIEDRLERAVLGSAQGLVTVSEPLAAKLRSKYRVPTTVIYNGYDPADYPPAGAAPPAANTLRILYAGSIHIGKQSPALLFAALRLLGSGRQRIQISFVGTNNPADVLNLAEEYGVRASVEVIPSVPYSESLRLQASSDVLLYLSWLDTSEAGFFSGKVFEYMGACRPILAVGPTHSDVCAVIRERGLGLALEDPEQIAEQLRVWTEQKLAGRAIDGPHHSAASDFSREQQARRLEQFLNLTICPTSPDETQ